MKFLNSIRKPDKEGKLINKIIVSALIFILGIFLGMFSKWLDNLALDSSIWWHNIIEHFDLNNFFSEYAIWLLIALAISVFAKTPVRAAINVLLFFVAMTISYHMYTVLFSGFNPKKYMMIWYSLTALSPFLGFISWYAKSSNKIAIIINSLIIYIMLSVCFGIGMWYFDFRSILYTLTFILSLVVIFKDIKVLSVSFVIGLILAFMIRTPYLAL